MVAVIRDHEVTVLELGAEYDALDAALFDSAKRELLSQADLAQPPRVVLDLSHTAYIGSTFVEILIRVWKRLRQRGGRMVLCGINPFCAEVLHVTRLDQLWENYADRASAVAAASRPG